MDRYGRARRSNRPEEGGAALSPGNPNHTPLKSFRIPAALYEAAQAKAEERGETVTDVVRRALERYVKRK